jgi:uncharacterized protein (DUF1778 family)
MARSQTINLRVSRAQKALIDRAAQTLGRNRSEFMLDAASREVETVLLDRRHFPLGAAEFRRFVGVLDKSPAPNPRLRRLLESKQQREK